MKADEYREQAEELERQAANAREPALREQYLKLAAGWRRLAASLPRKEDRDDHGSE